jgi:hypothetical protein
MALMYRNPFAREELHRQAVPATLQGCYWCGGTNAHGRLYAYRVETDGGRTYDVRGAFCSESCRKAYQS